jgi:DNA-binding IclR family transcriptional regulator
MQSSIIVKLLALLTMISETRKPLTFSEIVAQSGLNKSTIHRLLAIGMDENLLQFDKHRKVYFLGSKVFDLVRSAYHGYDIQAVALDEMLRLHARVDGNVTVGVLNGMDVTCLRVLEARVSHGVVQRAGMREPVHSSASGKALLAFLPDSILKAKLDGYVFERFTERTITDPEAFRRTLLAVRQAGFASNDREEYEHFNGIAAPIFNYLGEPIAVLNIWTAHARHPLPTLLEWTEDLCATADRISGLIGGMRPRLETLANR